jgi:hypothetical protein
LSSSGQRQVKSSQTMSKVDRQCHENVTFMRKAPLAGIRLAASETLSELGPPLQTQKRAGMIALSLAYGLAVALKKIGSMFAKGLPNGTPLPGNTP